MTKDTAQAVHTSTSSSPEAAARQWQTRTERLLAVAELNCQAALYCLRQVWDLRLSRGADRTEQDTLRHLMRRADDLAQDVRIYALKLQRREAEQQARAREVQDES